MTGQEVINSIGGIAVIVAAVAWFAKSMFEFTLRLKEIKYRRVDEKVGEVIAEAYERLHDLYAAVHSYVRDLEWSDEPSKEEKHRIVAVANAEFKKAGFAKRPYFPPKLFEATKELGGQLARIASGYTLAAR